jgi:hypothetical protein
MSLDGIERSVPPWRTWDWVHRGETFGHIKSFHQSENGSLLAWPLSAELLLSTDDGKTWKEAVKATANQGPKPGGADIRALDFEGASNASVLMVVRKSTGSDENLLVTLNTLTGKTDTLKAVLPDVPATGIQMAKDGTIWIAFRGKGIYVSLDHGRTFAAHNLGMGSRYPEALEMTSDGTLYAFTRAGLYRLQASSSIDPRGPALRRPGSGNRYGLRLGGLPDALQPHPSNAPIRIQADGRLLITPTPAP